MNANFKLFEIFQKFWNFPKAWAKIASLGPALNCLASVLEMAIGNVVLRSTRHAVRITVTCLQLSRDLVAYMISWHLLEIVFVHSRMLILQGMMMCRSIPMCFGQHAFFLSTFPVKTSLIALSVLCSWPASPSTLAHGIKLYAQHTLRCFVCGILTFFLICFQNTGHASSTLFCTASSLC